MEYRRQNGQPIVADMGVVVQEMVDAEAAGVMFTRDPFTGNPERIVITANYGLGEVSQSVCQSVSQSVSTGGPLLGRTH